MANEIKIPDEVTHLVDERSALWNEYDKSNKLSDEVATLGSKMPPDGRKADVGPLTPEKLPHNETQQALAEIRMTLPQIDKAQRDVHSTEREIVSIEAQAQRMQRLLIGMVIGGALLGMGVCVLVILAAL